MKGWLTKQGHIVKNWKKRHFVMNGDTLTYYKVDAAATVASGVIQLWGASVEEVPKAKSGKDFSFEDPQIKCGSAKEYLVYADTEEEMYSWMRAIAERVASLKTGAPPPPEEEPEPPAEAAQADDAEEQAAKAREEADQAALAQQEAEKALAEASEADRAQAEADLAKATAAAEEAERIAKEREAAATRIQALVRGRKGRKDFLAKKEAVQLKKKQEIAAVAIQRGARGMLARNHTKPLLEAKREEAKAKAEAEAKAKAEEEAKAKAEEEEGIKNRLIKGHTFLKHGRQGSPHIRLVFVTQDGTAIVWCKPGDRPKPAAVKGIKERMLRSEIQSIQAGRETAVFKKHKHSPEAVECSFSVIGQDRTLDLAAESAAIAQQWMDALQKWLKGE